MAKPYAIVFQDVIYGLGANLDAALADFENNATGMDVAGCDVVAIDDRAFSRISRTQNFDCMSAKALIAGKS
jgi:hypothetical protein